MRITALLFAMAVPLFAQDPAPAGSARKPAPDSAPKANLSKLAEDLGSDDYNVRDSATKAFITLGESVIPDLQELEKSKDPEVAWRAHKAIGTILRDKEIAKWYRPIKPFTMEFTGTAGEFLKKVSEQAGVKFATSIDSRPVKISLKNATFQQTLDALCYTMQDVRWRYRTVDNSIDFVKEWDACEGPAFYHSSFRVSLGKIDHLRTSFYKTEVGGVAFALISQNDHTAKPTTPVDFSVQEILDEAGHELTMQPLDPAQAALMTRLSKLEFEAGEAPFRAVGLTKGAKKLAKIRGTVGYYFPLSTQKVIFVSPSKGDAVEIGQFLVRIDDISSGNLKFTIRKDHGPTSLERHFNTASLKITGKDGQTWEGNVNGSASYTPNTPNDYTYTYYWYNGGDATQVELEIVTEYHYLQLPFEINNVPLP